MSEQAAFGIAALIGLCMIAGFVFGAELRELWRAYRD